MNSKLSSKLVIMKQSIEKQLKQFEEDKKNGVISESDRIYLEVAKPTYMENWNPVLFQHSMKTQIIPLTKEDVQLFIQVADGQVNCSSDTIPQLFSALYQKVEEALAHFPNGAFIRLGSRSPKDSWTAETKAYRLSHAKEVIVALLESSRVFEDLCLAERVSYLPSLVIREWVPIDKWREFRCFVKDGVLQGISQYFYYEVFPILQDEEKQNQIKAAIEKKFQELKDILPSDTVVFDVAYLENQTLLIEINPYSKDGPQYTDPCLFRWPIGSEGEFRFRNE